MATLNKNMLIGNLTRDPELRYTPQGKAVVTLGLAVNRTYGKGDDKKQETCFINVVVWGASAEACNQYLNKGSSVFVEGRLQSRSYEDKDGNKKTVIEVVAENVQFLTPKSEQTVSKTESVPDDDYDNKPFAGEEGYIPEENMF